jgi:hypothetical protein
MPSKAISAHGGNPTCARERAASRQARGAARPAGVVLEASEKLAALGYVRLGAMRVRSQFGRGVDPKDRIRAFENYHGVLNEIGFGKISEAILGRIQEIRRQAPELHSLVFLEAQALDRLGRPQDALARYGRGWLSNRGTPSRGQVWQA